MAEQVNLKAEKPRKNFITLNERESKPVFIRRKGYTEKNEEKTIRHLSLTANIVGVVCLLLFSFCIFVFFSEVFLPSITGEKEETNEIVVIIPPEEDEQAESEINKGILSYDEKTGIPIYSDKFNLYIVNNSNPQDENYKMELEEVGGVKVDSRISTALRILLNAAKEDGINLEFECGYLTKEQQQTRYDNKYTELLETGESTLIMASFKTGRTVGIPGRCEESTGMSVTVKGDIETYTETDTYKWLKSNAADYGFIFRFTNGKADLTGRDPDYRVLRFVGRDNALKMRQLSFCLEEFVRYKNQAK